jgi:putative membrane protein
MSMKNIIALALVGAAAPALAQPVPQAPPIQARTSAATYVGMAASADTYEKESSQAILQHASNPEVRAFAEMMIRDHANTTAQVMAAAKAASIGKPGGPLPKHAMMLKALREMPHASMERGYVDQQVMAHEEALALHQGYAAQGDNPGLKAVAASAVPIIERHLAEIRRIQTAMGGPMKGSRGM